MEDYNFSTTTGTKNSALLFSLGYLNQDGIVDKTGYQRYTMRVNSESKLSERIKIGENLNLSATHNTGQYDNSSWGSAVNGALTTSPICYVRDNSSMSESEKVAKNIGGEGFGLPWYGAQVSNPEVGIYYNNRSTGTYRAAGNLFLEIEFIKNLTYTTRFGGDINFYEMNNFTPHYVVSVPILATGQALVERELDQNITWNWQHVLDYKNTFLNDHKVDIMAGFEANEWNEKTLYGKADSLYGGGTVPQFQYISSTQRSVGSANYLAQGTAYETSNMAYFGRINYEFKNIFLAQFSYRYDGSSNFGYDHFFGSFPAFSAGFKFTELDFVKNNLKFISFGKIRYGWGETGNSNIQPNHVYSSVVSPTGTYGYVFGGNLTTGSVPGAPGNTDLHWESMVTNDVGLDMNFLDNKISFTADYFDKENNGMLEMIQAPAVSGTYNGSGVNTSLFQYAKNVGGLSNKGIELSIGSKGNIVGDLKYTFDANFTKVVSKCFNLQDTIQNTYFNGQNISYTENGQAPGVFYGYKTNGIYHNSDLGTINGKAKQVIVNQPHYLDSKGNTVLAFLTAGPGDVRFVDINHDGKINGSDITMIGNPNPKFTYGFSGSFAFKSFDLNYFFQGSYGNQIFNTMKLNWYSPTATGNWTKDALNAYHAPVVDKNGNVLSPGNTTSSQFRLWNTGVNNYMNSDWYVEDGSYLRLKSIQIGYTLPKTLTNYAGIERFRIYVGAKNLLTFTKYSGTDPEMASSNPMAQGVDYGVYPQARMYMAGIELTF
jgi:TonB-linked SusC/RagA family outer membrane protein